MVCLFSSFTIASVSEENSLSLNAKEQISFPMRESAEFPSLSKVMGVLFLGGVLVFGAVFLLKKYVYKSLYVHDETSVINIVSSKKITTKLSAHLIEVRKNKYLIVEKGVSITVVDHKEEVECT
jgi:flagellar biogenesis protein FliO